MSDCLLIDGNNIVFRAYYAFSSQRLKTSYGLPTGAVYGFLRMILKLLKERQPKMVAVAFDTSRDTFRKKMYPEYKAKRKPTPEDLLEQLPLAQKAIEALGIQVLKNPEFEADDLIGSLAKQLENDYKVSVVTGDRDLLQLIDDRINVELCQKGTSDTKEIDTAAFVEEYGFEPMGIIELKALMGDSSDNIPGVKGIGEKKGMALIQEFNTIDDLYKNIEKVSNDKMREKLIADKEMAFLSHDLATIRCNIPDLPSIDLLRWDENQLEKSDFTSFLQKLEFGSLYKEFAGKELGKPGELFPSTELKKLPGERLLINDVAELKRFFEELNDEICVDVETNGLDPFKDRIIGVSVAGSTSKAIYVPLRHSYLGMEPGDQMAAEEFFPLLTEAMKGRRLIGHNLKFDISFLDQEGVSIPPKMFDTMLAAYVIDPTRSNALKKLGKEMLGFEVTEYGDVAGNETFENVSLADATEYGCQDTLLTMHLFSELKSELEKERLAKLFENLEMPLVGILAQMEKTGIRLNESYIKNLSREIADRLVELEKIIHDHAGHTFNISSTKQLQQVLFEELGLTPPKKTKTGYSTDSEVLTKLAFVHPICEALLEFRELAKLQSTYTESLLKLVHGKTGLIHTSFNQAVTATGRLSSSNPNMQNIPIKTEWGRKIRRAFLPPREGDSLISIDYSQIELRLLAHFSEDPALLKGYHENIDIHAITAGRLFGKEPEEVTSDERRVGKTVNFGIIYGISAHGLAEDLGISRPQAQTYIDSFYNNFTGVTKFFDSVVEEAREAGYVETLLDRVRKLPDINSKKFQARSGAERVAKNTRLQGSAADLVKKSMIDSVKMLCEKGFQTQLILQIHDELVFSVPQEELEKVCDLLKNTMEQTISLKVPLICDVAVGDNLADLKDI